MALEIEEVKGRERVKAEIHFGIIWQKDLAVQDERNF